VGYAVAIAACLAAFLAAFSGRTLFSPFLPAFAAVIISAVWAGPGPGLLATLICSVLVNFELAAAGASTNSALLSAVLFAAEGCLLSLGSAWIPRTANLAVSGGIQPQLIENSSQAIWIQDRTSVITWANTRTAELLGVSREGLIGRSTEDFYFPSDHAVEGIRTESLASGLGQSGVNQQFDRRLRRADGSELWVIACCHATGESGDCIAMMTDITERKRAEQTLRRSEQRHRDLFESLAEGVYQSTADGKIVAANPALVEILGFTREAQLREADFTKDICVDPTFRRRLLEQLFREGSLKNVEYQVRTANGRVVTVLENAWLLRDEQDSIAGFRGAITDVTQLRNMEEQLGTARKLEALGRLASGIARDFHAALVTITDRLESGQTQQAEDAAKQAMALTAQLLSLSGKADAAADARQQAAETILLVEKDPLIRELSRDMLERQGYRVVLVTEAAEAERAALTSHFHLLITDIGTDGTPAEELARRLRASRPDLRVLFVAGYSDPPRDETEPLLPGTGHIARPFSAETLSRKVRQLLDTV
jgi:PAS domain S-box-containing protein